VGFTGSRSGGTALMARAAARSVPIPVYAEMSSTNPVLLFPHALASRAEAIAAQFVSALVLGAGQFCTNPGLLLAVEGPTLDTFVAAARILLSQQAPATMLSPEICDAYTSGLSRFAEHQAVYTEALGGPAGFGQGQPALFFDHRQRILVRCSPAPGDFRCGGTVRTLPRHGHIRACGTTARRPIDRGDAN
jgi:NADP-dependent aldehyde dehydrogenase